MSFRIDGVRAATEGEAKPARRHRSEHDEFALMTRALRVVTITCIAHGRSYAANLGDHHRKHGALCVVCGFEFPPGSCPDHEVKP